MPKGISTVLGPRDPKNKFALQFGKMLRRRRVELGYCLREFARDTGIPKSTVSWIERGYQDPWGMSLRLLLKISRSYRIKPDALLKRIDEMLLGAEL